VAIYRQTGRVAASDRRAQTEFDGLYAQLVVAAHKAASSFFRYDPARTEDIVAEALARTYERWEKVRRHDNPVGWVVVCTKNVCLEEIRREIRARKHSPAPIDPVGYGDQAEESAAAQAIAHALDQLSKRQRDVAVLRYLMDLDEATTASALGTTVSKVKTAAHEARGRLRALLDDYYGIGAGLDV
jgi:RNA polymerase sigma factor (sigma-70 family)